MDQSNPFRISYENKTDPRTSHKKRKNVVLGSLALTMVAGTSFILAQRFMREHDAGKTPSRPDIVGSLDDETMTKRQLATFVAQFLMNYYNYSYTTYAQAVKRAEEAMTPAFQSEFSQKAVDLEFVRMLQEKQVSTDAFRILPDSLEFARSGNTHYVKLTGSMTYTTGINGAQAEWPTSVLIEVLETEQGYKVNNVQRQR
jgi:hypothetical protein